MTRFVPIPNAIYFTSPGIGPVSGSVIESASLHLGQRLYVAFSLRNN
jgi:hypothetical protein